MIAAPALIPAKPLGAKPPSAGSFQLDRLDQGDAHGHEEENDADLEQHHRVVGIGRLLDADHQEHGDERDHQEGGEIGDDRNAEEVGRGGQGGGQVRVGRIGGARRDRVGRHVRRADVGRKPGRERRCPKWLNSSRK